MTYRYEIYQADKTDEALVKFVLSGNTNATVDSVELGNAEDAEKFKIRCVSKATRKYAVGIIDGKTLESKKYRIPLKIKVKGVVKPIKTTINIGIN